LREATEGARLDNAAKGVTAELAERAEAEALLFAMRNPEAGSENGNSEDQTIAMRGARRRGSSATRTTRQKKMYQIVTTIYYLCVSGERARLMAYS
jgi:hypothetical protein